MSTKRILGIDFGLRRIGIAVSAPGNIIALGVKVIENTPRATTEIRHLAETYDVDVIVVGLPVRLNGTMGEIAREADRFMQALKVTTGREIIPWDERFTSQTAKQTLLDLGVPKKQRQSKERIDLLASALILQGYLDRQQYLSTRNSQ